jgi:LysR family nitrogen assimilation transcriptional regulator
MDIRQLRYFLGIVEQRSLSRAAEFLHVAQPALTLHLKRLELEFGCQLVERTSRGVVPTEFGHRLAQRAKVLLEDLNHLRDEVRGMTTAPAGSAFIGIPTSLGSTLTVPLVMATQERFPLVRLRVAEGLSGHMQDWLLAGLVDLAVVFGKAPLPGLVAQAVMREPLAFIAPRGDKLAAGRTTMDLGDALVLPLILPGRPHGLRAEVELAASKLRRRPNVTVEIDAMDQIKSLVAKRAGYSILSSRFAHQGPIATELAILPIANPAIERTISLAHAKDRPMSIAARAVHATMLEMLSAVLKAAPSAAASPRSRPNPKKRRA